MDGLAMAGTALQSDHYIDGGGRVCASKAGFLTAAACNFPVGIGLAVRSGWRGR